MLEDPGYWIEQNVFLEAEAKELLDSLASSPAGRSRAGARHLMGDPRIAALARDSKLLAIAQKGLGAVPIPYRATLFEKSAAANWFVAWHQDTALPLQCKFDMPGWGPWSNKGGIPYAHAPAEALVRILALRIHLDASTSENGPLRVIPRSHTGGVLMEEKISALVAGTTATQCLVGCGGVLAMRPLLIHSSSKARNNAPRRVLHIEYADTLDLAPGIRLALA
jgi:ectoine hydroxylase-related dioxygenase (phytanoyl-CoA dioxygenase family)